MVESRSVPSGKKVTATICLETPAFGRGRVACGDRQMVAVTFFRARLEDRESYTVHTSPLRRIAVASRVSVMRQTSTRRRHRSVRRLASR